MTLPCDLQIIAPINMRFCDDLMRICDDFGDKCPVILQSPHHSICALQDIYQNRHTEVVARQAGIEGVPGGLLEISDLVQIGVQLLALCCVQLQTFAAD
jgi:hypothetical protein